MKTKKGTKDTSPKWCAMNSFSLENSHVSTVIHAIMNALKNNVQLSGQVGRTPEILTLSSGQKFAKFSLAIRETYTSQKGEEIIHTHWHYVIAMGKMAEIVQRQVCRGREIEIGGKLSSRSYKDKNGYRRNVTEIVCRDLFLPKK